MSAIPPGPDDDGYEPWEEPEGSVATGGYEDSQTLHSFISVAPILKRGEILKNQDTDDKPEMQSEATVVAGETIMEVESNIDSLPEPYRTAVRLHSLEGYSYPDLVKLLRLPIGTLKSQISRGKKLLKKLSEEPTSVYRNQLHLEQMQTLVATYGDRLPEPYQTPMKLHYLDKDSYPEIAQRLQQPMGTIKSYINRGTKILHTLRDKEEGSVGALEGEDL